MSDITNEMILKRLGWTVEIGRFLGTQGYCLLNPNKQICAARSKAEWAWDQADDYIGSLNHAITLTVPGCRLVLSAVDKSTWGGEWEACYVNKIDDSITAKYDDTPARAICKAWLMAMDAIEKDQ